MSSAYNIEWSIRDMIRRSFQSFFKKGWQKWSSEVYTNEFKNTFVDLLMIAASDQKTMKDL